MTVFRLLNRFEETFRNGPYLHRNSQLGNRIADFLFDDLYLLDTASRFRLDIDAGRVVLNPKGVSPGLRSRRGDGSLGPIVPGHSPQPYAGHAIPIGPTAEVDIGAEVKIVAKAMIKQDRSRYQRPLRTEPIVQDQESRRDFGWISWSKPRPTLRLV